MAAFIGGSLGFQVGIYLWHVPEAFPRPVEKRRETFVQEHHVAPPKKSLRAPEHVPWASYITNTTHSQQEIRTPAYDSRHIWASPDTCGWPSTPPPRPSAVFEKTIQRVCETYSTACELFNKTLVDTWDHGITWLRDGSVFLVTGDIPLMWLRDSAAQVTHYMDLADDPSIQRLIEGILRRMMVWISLDVYGSAFRMFLDFDHAGKERLTDWDFKCGRTIHVAQHDYEPDSLSYVIRLGYLYWKKTGRTCWMTSEWLKTLHRIVDLWILEQRHETSSYTYPTLKNGGKGTRTCYTGMTWGGMRPSDDSMTYHYNIPENLFVAKVLEYVMEFAVEDRPLHAKASKLRKEILTGVQEYGIRNGIIAYEVDGCQNMLFADDANIPSLLSLPYLGVDVSGLPYDATRAFILSSKNPWYTSGEVSGIGSPHTSGRGHPWHMAMIMEGWEDMSTLERVLRTAHKGALHESVTSTSFTREWFGWTNALFAEWLMRPVATPSSSTVRTDELYAAIDYTMPDNKGPWKQGWDYEYDNRFKHLTIHVVPHSHNDPGWLKTYHDYYSTQTKHILDTVVATLIEDARRTFIWAEISYFSLWWKDASDQQKTQTRILIENKQLEFVTGGWVMNDEASVTARAVRAQLKEGRDWLKETFDYVPKYSWQIDPFGHASGQAVVLKEFGYEGMLIQRVHYHIKKQLAKKNQLEFMWHGVKTHMMPYFSYDGPHTCGPDPAICCQFDFARMYAYGGCPWGKKPVSITDENVQERASLWLDQVYKKAMLYNHGHVLIPVGDDFRYQNRQEALAQFENYQRMFDWLNKNKDVDVSFSTLGRYLAAIPTPTTTMKGSFFPYSDRDQDYWTGYFNSRIFYKGYDRLLESHLAAAEQACPDEPLHEERRALALFQHHDGITGTAKSHVVQDYYRTMKKAVDALSKHIHICKNIQPGQSWNPTKLTTPTHLPGEIKDVKEESCTPTKWIPARIVIEDGLIVTLDAVDVQESVVWRTNQGADKAGAYLMAVRDGEEVMKVSGWEVCRTPSSEWRLTTRMGLVTRVATIQGGFPIRIRYDVDVTSRMNGELWATWKTDINKICTDVHGLHVECHTLNARAPLQSQFWPTPTMGWVVQGAHRLAMVGAQPTGTGVVDGRWVWMLDRCGNRDDSRGLGQGITDARKVSLTFDVWMESDVGDDDISRAGKDYRERVLNPIYVQKDIVYDDDKTPPLDVVWARGWYNIGTHRKIPRAYFNPGTVDNLQFFRDPCPASKPIWIRTKHLFWWYKRVFKTITCDVTIITSDDITDIPSKDFHYELLKSPRLKMWYAQDVVDSHPKLQAIPVGLPLHYGCPGCENEKVTMTRLTAMYRERTPYATRTPKILFDPGTYVKGGKERRDVYRAAAFDVLSTCETIQVMQRKPTFDAWQTYASYPFAVAVPGTGWDVYRFWEFLWFETVPIVKKGAFSDSFAGTGLPMIVVEKWQDVCMMDVDALMREWAPHTKTFHTWLKPSTWIPRKSIPRKSSSPIVINHGKRRVPCDVPCFWPASGGGILRTIHIDNLDATMTMSMEGEAYYPSLQLKNRKLNHYIASTRLDSDIPMPYYNWPWTLYMDKTPDGDDIWSRNNIQTAHVPFSDVKKAGIFVARNCNSKSNRESLVRALMSKMPVDSVSSCLHNFDIGDTSDKRAMMRQYAMYFAFENQRVDDYITEKLWETFRAGVLPVYFGAPNIKQHVPDHSIVHVDDFETYDDLAVHLRAILSDKALYDSYHAWRYKPLPQWFVRLYNFTHVHSECRVCRFVSAKILEQQWDPVQQQKRMVHAIKLETAEKDGNHHKHEMVVVTGANSGYFHALENFIGSMHFWEPTRQIVVYNLGLTSSQIEQVNMWHNVQLEWPRGIPSTYALHVHALKKYAWKTNAIYESTKKYVSTLWLDAGCEVRGPLTVIESILRKDGVFLVQGQDEDMTRWVHDGTFGYFKVERSAFSKKPSFAGGIEGWALNSEAYHKILEPLVECANKKECIDPSGASFGNHRYDQSALSVITYTSGMGIVPHTEFLAASSSQLHADIKKPNTMCIWTARGGSSAYKQYIKTKKG